MTRSAPISFPVSVRELLEAIHHSLLAGPHAPGVDGRGYLDTFGTGLGSPEDIATVNRLRSRRNNYPLSETKRVDILDFITGKKRTLNIPTYDDRMILRALTKQIPSYLPYSRVDYGRPWVDARASVALIADERRRKYPGPLDLRRLGRARLIPLPSAVPLIGLKMDIKSAFDSLDWMAVLHSPWALRHLPEQQRAALEAVYSFYSASGTGVPLGLPTSGEMLRIALIEVDHYLMSLNAPAYRVVDDMAVLLEDPERAEKVMDGVRARLAPFGLTLSAEKSRVCPGDMDWLGHSLGNDGQMDLAEKTATRLQVLAVAADQEKAERVVPALHHFAMASKGEGFRTTVTVLEKRLGKPIHWPGEDYQDSWFGPSGDTRHGAGDKGRNQGSPGGGC